LVDEFIVNNYARGIFKII